MLLTVDFHEDFIDVKSIAISTSLSLQSACIDSAEFYTPKPDGFAADGDAALSEKIFDIPMAQIESIVEPDCVAYYVGWESVLMKWTPLVEPAS
jgi:hypothetical protein